MRVKQRLRTALLKNRDGATAVEMAFAVPIFLALLTGVMGFSHMFWVRNSFHFALDRAGRYAVMHPAATDEQIQSVIEANVQGVNLENMSVDVNDVTEGGKTSRVISVSYDYHFLGGLVHSLPSTVSSEISVPIDSSE